MYYIIKLIFLIIFTDPDIHIEYWNEYPKSGYPETMNPDPDIKFTDPTDPDPDTLNFPDIRIRDRPN